MECPVCTQLYDMNRHLPLVINCGHSACGKCLDSMTDNVCPICRQGIKTKKKNFALIQLLQVQTLKREQSMNKLSDKVDIEALYKISFVGNQSVGKTSVINFIKSFKFSTQTIPTIGIDFTFIDVEVDGKTYRFQLWDTAGQEQYRSIAKNHYLSSDLIVVTYAVNDVKSFKEIQSYWLDQIMQVSPDSKILLLGNKSELPWEFNYKNVTNLASEIRAMHAQISCKTGDNVIETWNHVVHYLIKRQGRSSLTRTMIKSTHPPPKSWLTKLKECFGLLD